MKNSQLNLIGVTAFPATEAQTSIRQDFAKRQEHLWNNPAPLAFNYQLNQEGFHEIPYFDIFSGALLGGVPRFRRRYRRSEQFYHASPGRSDDRSQWHRHRPTRALSRS